MEIFEITGLQTGVSRSGVNYLQPADSFEFIENGYINRQVLQSRQGISLFAPRLSNNSRVFLLTTFIKTDGSTELLTADANFLYKYNVGTRVFDQLAFGGSMAGYAGFGITDKGAYISGTAYPDKNNGSRFVFTGYGITANANGSSVFFYTPSNGDVRDFTSIADNPDYEAPSQGALQRATHMLYFNERINFIKPRIDGTTYEQGILFSGIRDADGTGEKFKSPGSGLIQLDTFETIAGASIYGQYIALNLSGSNWILEKTTDAFNPYITKKLPSVIGTDAPFSFAQWNSRIYSLGQEGILVMDFRESLRSDDKIPFFTRDEMDSNTFYYNYGGFNRYTSQFIWSYLSDEDLFTTQDKLLTYNYSEDSWSTYDLFLTVFGQYDAEEALTWSQIEPISAGGITLHPEWSQWNTTEDIFSKIGIGNKYKLTLAGDDNGFIYALNTDYDDKTTLITGITQASQAVLTVEPSNFSAGDFVILQNVGGMTEINNYDPDTDEEEVVFYTVVSATATSITLNVDSTNFTAYTTGGTISQPIFFRAKTNPFNPYRGDGRRCYINTIECLINVNGGFLFVDVFADGDTDPFIENVLLKPDVAIQRDRQWVSMVIDHEAEFFSFQFRQSSPAVGVQITSIRIHAEPGGLTDG